MHTNKFIPSGWFKWSQASLQIRPDHGPIYAQAFLAKWANLHRLGK